MVFATCKQETTQPTFLLEPQPLVHDDRRLIKTVDVDGDLLVTQFPEKVGLDVADRLRCVALLPVFAADADPV